MDVKEVVVRVGKKVALREKVQVVWKVQRLVSSTGG